MKKKLLYLLLIIAGYTKAQQTDDLNLSKMIQPADSNLFIRDNYYNWCNSIIKDDYGKYHLFYSRWPKQNGFFAWLTHSEIAHAVADKPWGPYNRKTTVLNSRRGEWDAIATHNVKVNRFGNKYYMYYTATNAGNETLTDDKLKEIAGTGYTHPYWDILRSNQRTGVAQSSSLNGPWKRKNKPMIEPHGIIRTVSVNPAIEKGPEGKYYLIIKGDDARITKRKLIQAIGTSSKPTGPFKLSDKAAFDEIPTEDVSMWYDRKRQRFYGIFHAHGGNFIGLITSKNGIDWEKAKHYEVCKKEVRLSDGSSMKVDRMERPFVYTENDEPIMLSFAVKKGKESFIIFYPLSNL